MVEAQWETSEPTANGNDPEPCSIEPYSTKPMEVAEWDTNATSEDWNEIESHLTEPINRLLLELEARLEETRKSRQQEYDTFFPIKNNHTLQHYRKNNLVILHDIIVAGIKAKEACVMFVNGQIEDSMLHRHADNMGSLINRFHNTLDQALSRSNWNIGPRDDEDVPDFFDRVKTPSGESVYEIITQARHQSAHLAGTRAFDHEDRVCYAAMYLPEYVDFIVAEYDRRYEVFLKMQAFDTMLPFAPEDEWEKGTFQEWEHNQWVAPPAAEGIDAPANGTTDSPAQAWFTGFGWHGID